MPSLPSTVNVEQKCWNVSIELIQVSTQVITKPFYTYEEIMLKLVFCEGSSRYLYRESTVDLPCRSANILVYSRLALNVKFLSLPVQNTESSEIFFMWYVRLIFIRAIHGNWPRVASLPPMIRSANASPQISSNLCGQFGCARKSTNLGTPNTSVITLNTRTTVNLYILLVDFRVLKTTVLKTD